VIASARHVVAASAAFALGCAGTPRLVPPASPAAITPASVTAEDTAHKEDLRLVPPEAYMRTYLQLFGGLAPQDVQKAARGRDGSQLFDTWDDYVSALGFPDYRLDIPRQTQTNALMIATFERLGVALCDRALEHDWKGKEPVAPKDRLVFAFDPPAGEMDAKRFAEGFDVLHRTFLGYPASLAPPTRAARFLALYESIAAEHAAKRERSRFTPAEAAWASVCYGLVRHPELHLY
jgi:hypothetical protein